jgi:anti-anti-sigma factor
MEGKMGDFERIYVDDVLVIVVNLTSATIYNAKTFKKIIDDELNSCYKLFIIDLSKCEKMNSMFFGAVVGALNRINDIGGKLKIVEPENPMGDIFNKTDTRKLFEICNTSEEALKELDVNS